MLDIAVVLYAGREPPAGGSPAALGSADDRGRGEYPPVTLSLMIISSLIICKPEGRKADMSVLQGTGAGCVLGVC
jgi:hypothetical protein